MIWVVILIHIFREKCFITKIYAHHWNDIAKKNIFLCSVDSVTSHLAP